MSASSSKSTTHLAVDLGAGSGRVMAGHFDGSQLRLDEVHRFASDGISLPTGWHWNAPQIFTDIKLGLREARRRHGDSIVSLAVDTWGVDYALLDRRGRLLGLPWMYRDARTDGMIEEACRLVSQAEIDQRTGIQFMFFNTLFQLLAEKRDHPEVLAVAEQMLFMPDLMSYWLSGERVCERTIASTSQLLAVGTAQWDHELIAKLGLPIRLFAEITEPGQKIGTLLASVAQETGLSGIAVTTCGGHDTASAVAGVPATTPQPLFLSSGTWSLLGRELAAPLVNAETFAAGFSNEQGLNGTTRFLKNVAGMWLLQECKRQWSADGTDADFATLVLEAESATATMWLNPDASDFAKPCDMPAAIRAYAQKTGQRAPSTRGEFTRSILESLAIRYRILLATMRSWMPDFPDTLHVVGGGSQNALLNQMTADATGLVVVAGPVESTAAGNILAQLMATGHIHSLEQGRAIIRASFEPKIFHPRPDPRWDALAVTFSNLPQ